MVHILIKIANRSLKATISNPGNSHGTISLFGVFLTTIMFELAEIYNLDSFQCHSVSELEHWRANLIETMSKREAI